MITYQVEVVVPNVLIEQWLGYMTSEHIDDVVKTGYFTSARLTRVIDSTLPDATVFRVIYTLPSLEALEEYQRNSAPALQAHHTELFGTAVRATRSVTELLWSQGRSHPVESFHQYTSGSSASCSYAELGLLRNMLPASR